MKKVLVLILASASLSLFAMDAPGQQEQALNDKLVSAVSKGNLDEIGQLISAGASLNPPLYLQNPLRVGFLLSIIPFKDQKRLEVLKFLLDNGAKIDIEADGCSRTPLMIAAGSGTPEEVQLLLTSIPLDEHQYIKNSFPFFSKKMRISKLISKDTHGAIQEQAIAQLVQRQMERIIKLLEMKDCNGKTTRDLGLNNYLTTRREPIGKLLDLNNPESYAQIRAAVEHNVRRVLFAPQENIN
jgi:hypothetical protein